jgi:hypothetical protein
MLNFFMWSRTGVLQFFGGGTDNAICISIEGIDFGVMGMSEGCLILIV